MPPDARVSGGDVVARRAGPLSTLLDGEVVALSVDLGRYYAMGETGSQVWQLTEQPVRVVEVVSQLCTEFDVDEETCLHDVLSFVEQLLRERLLAVLP
jgi:hypothetical protein